MAKSSDFLNTVYENIQQVKLGVLLDFLAGLIGGIIVIVFFPVLKKVSPSIAYWVFGLWIIQYCVAAVGSLNQLALLALRKTYHDAQSNIDIYTARR